MTGFFYGDKGQLVASVIGILVNIAHIGSMADVAFFVIGKLFGNRVTAEGEINGLDLPEMGVHGYAPDAGAQLGASPRMPDAIGAATAQALAHKPT